MVGVWEGAREGEREGALDGAFEGDRVGDCEVGFGVGGVGGLDGVLDGERDGAKEKTIDGVLGCLKEIGASDGIRVGGSIVGGGLAPTPPFMVRVSAHADVKRSSVRRACAHVGSNIFSF